MKYQDFKNKYIGKGIDFDNYYGFQCMDLYQQYNKEVIGAPHIPANAYQVWDNYPKDYYDKIENASDNVPQQGDVVIWNQNAGGGYGHIAVFDNGGFEDTFQSLDQNWPVGSITHLQDHNYNNVIGWLRPKKQQTESSTDDWKKVAHDNILIAAFKRSITPDDKSESWKDGKLEERLFDHIDTQEKRIKELIGKLNDALIASEGENPPSESTVSPEPILVPEPIHPPDPIQKFINWLFKIFK